MTHPDTMILRRRRVSLTLKLIGVLFIVLLLMRTDWLAAVFQSRSDPSHDRGYNNDKTPQLKQHGGSNGGDRMSLLRQLIGGQQKPECTLPKLKNVAYVEDSHLTLCKRIQPFKSSCKLADELFGDPLNLDVVNACKTKTMKTYCKVEGSPEKWTSKCDVTSCDETLHLGIKDVESGEVKWTAHNSVIELQNHIEHLISNDNVGYCYIDCVGRDHTRDKKRVHQILNLPPHSNDGPSSHGKTPVNINIIFIDSVSRHHFYRSLPRTVEALDKLASDSNTLIFDFEKVQGVRSRTFETIQTLFSGDINPFEIPFGTQAMPSKKLGVSELYKPFKELGYSTLWLEDLCPYWEWGLSKDLLVYNSSLDQEGLHRKFMAAVKEAGIDSIGNTLSSCDILKANGRPDPFHGLNKVCYNGQHQHEYLLDYLKMYMEEKQHRSQPYVSFFETNIGHESSGKRIQYFDVAFKDYLEHTYNMGNTLTVILSDHGNAYGDFVNTGQEGRLEMYHPFLFMIMPRDVQTVFSAEQLQSIKQNQNRLISVLDLHYTLTYIIEKIHHTHTDNTHKSRTNFNSRVSDFNHRFNVSRFGLLDDISPSRTCSHIPRVMPNLCICEGYDTAVSGNLGYHEVLALYFIGTLNNEILKQRQDRTGPGLMKIGGFHHCKRFTMNKVKNIQQSNIDGDDMMAKMDLHVHTSDQQTDEIFFISVHIRHGTMITLGSFERVTPYSQFSVCTDRGVNSKLCVCDLRSSNTAEIDTDSDGGMNSVQEDGEEVLLESGMPPSMTNKIKTVGIHDKECVYIISHSNKFGIVYEAFNNCTIPLKLSITLDVVNTLLSTDKSFEVILLPGDVKFLTAGVQDSKNKWSCVINVTNVVDLSESGV